MSVCLLCTGHSLRSHNTVIKVRNLTWLGYSIDLIQVFSSCPVFSPCPSRGGKIHCKIRPGIMSRIYLHSSLVSSFFLDYFSVFVSDIEIFEECGPDIL